MVTSLSLHPNHILILLILLGGIIILYFIIFIYKNKNSSNNRVIFLIILAIMFGIGCLKFLDSLSNYYSEEITEEITENIIEKKDTNFSTFIMDEENYYPYNFGDKIELTIPKIYEPIEGKNGLIIFKYKNNYAIKNMELLLTYLSIGSINKDSSKMNQDNIFTYSENEFDKITGLTDENFFKMMISQGFENYELENISISGQTTHSGCNFISKKYILNKEGKKIIMNYSLIPLENEFILYTTSSYLENEQEVNTIMDNIRILE